jgi:hypothetical protein
MSRKNANVYDDDDDEEEADDDYEVESILDRKMKIREGEVRHFICMPQFGSKSPFSIT